MKIAGNLYYVHRIIFFLQGVNDVYDFDTITIV